MSCSYEEPLAVTHRVIGATGSARPAPGISFPERNSALSDSKHELVESGTQTASSV